MRRIVRTPPGSHSSEPNPWTTWRISFVLFRAQETKTGHHEQGHTASAPTWHLPYWDAFHGWQKPEKVRRDLRQRRAGGRIDSRARHADRCSNGRRNAGHDVDLAVRSRRRFAGRMVADQDRDLSRKRPASRRRPATCLAAGFDDPLALRFRPRRGSFDQRRLRASRRLRIHAPPLTHDHVLTHWSGAIASIRSSPPS